MFIETNQKLLSETFNFSKNALFLDYAIVSLGDFASLTLGPYKHPHRGKYVVINHILVHWLV